MSSASVRRRAVIVGINTYSDPDITNLDGAVNDADDIRKHLTTCGGFDVPDKHFLVDERATCLTIRKAISDLLWQTDPSDMVLFYFSGHAFVDSYTNGYLAPHDMLKHEPFVRGIKMDELKRTVLNSINKPTVGVCT